MYIWLGQPKNPDSDQSGIEEVCFEVKRKNRRVLVWIAAAVSTAVCVGVLLTTIVFYDGGGDSEILIPASTNPINRSRLAYSSSTIFSSNSASKKVEEQNVLLVQEERPIKISIPSLNLEAFIVPVGLTSHGTMATPRKFSEVGWYEFGSSPGFTGNAVLAGHVDNGLGLGGVFRDLESIKKGDLVYIKMKSGKEVRFIVSEMDVYDYKDAPSDQIFNRSGSPKIKLITCTGSWLVSAKTYDSRLVVTGYLDG